MLAASARAELAGVADPFPGLRPFESEEDLIFRGRRQHTDELLRRLAEHRFLAVVGTSGSGKSSLVRAGLRPALDRGYLAGATSRWTIAMMRPGMAPIANLAEALRQEEALGAADESTLKSSRLGLVEVVRKAHLAHGESLLVVADQFEEIFRFSRRMSAVDGGAEAALFVSLLLTAAARTDAPIYVVLTMRSDFLGDCAQFPRLPEALSESQYLIPRLTREQRAQAIEEPLRLFGATMTPQLVEQLLNDSADETARAVDDASAGARYRGGAPDPLPVLQHALMRTYVQWKALPPEQATQSIDLIHYRNAGGMASALDQQAEDLFANQLDDDGRKWTERIFRCLTTTELGRPVRRPTPLDELYRIIGAVQPSDRDKVDRLLALFEERQISFLRVYKDKTVDISHESLIWKWKRLSRWLELEAAGAELYRDLAKDALGKATWGDPKLAGALAVRERDAWNQDWALQYSGAKFTDVEAFLKRSRIAARNEKWLRWFGWAAAAALVILGVVLYYSWRQTLQKQRDLEATSIARDSLANALKNREQEQAGLAGRLAELNANQGATKEERDQIAKQKADVEAKLAKSQEDSKKLASQVQQSTDLVASVKSLQSELQQVQRDRDAATQKASSEKKLREDAESKSASEKKLREDAENKASQLEAQLNSLKKAQDATPSPPPEETAKQNAIPPAPALSITQPTASAGMEPRVLQVSQTVFSVAWSPDGRTLASACNDKAIRVWDVAGGKLLRTLNGDQSPVWSVAWSPDGKTLASGGADNKTIQVWDVASGKLRTLQGHTHNVTSVAWSSDGKTLASGSWDKTIRLWDASNGILLRTLQGHTDYVLSVAWSPDGKTLASASLDGTARLWEPMTGRMLTTLQTINSKVYGVAWSPDGKTLASASSDHTVRVWDPATGRSLRTLRCRQEIPQSVAWSPDGKTLAVGTRDNRVWIWGAATGEVLRTLQGHGRDVTSVAWSPDGKTLASGSLDSTIRLWPIGSASK
jgi:Tol biopolymer transport system component